jgi:hypothetical protein
MLILSCMNFNKDIVSEEHNDLLTSHIDGSSVCEHLLTVVVSCACVYGTVS